MRQTPRSIAAIALLAVAAAFAPGLAGCNTEPTCEKAADRLLELIDEQNEKVLAKFPESQRKQLAEMTSKSLPKERLVEDCKARFTKEQLACTVAAKSLEDASKCNQAAAPPGVEPTPGATPDQPAPAPAPDQPAPAPDQPAAGATPGAEGAGAPAAAPQAPATGEPAQAAPPAQPQ